MLPMDGWKIIKSQQRGVAIFAKACFGHPSPSKRQKLKGKGSLA
jgi:hypothetical protein